MAGLSGGVVRLPGLLLAPVTAGAPRLFFDGGGGSSVRVALAAQGVAAAAAASLMLSISGPKFRFELPAPGQTAATGLPATAATPVGTCWRGIQQHWRVYVTAGLPAALVAAAGQCGAVALPSIGAKLGLHPAAVASTLVAAKYVAAVCTNLVSRRENGGSRACILHASA